MRIEGMLGKITSGKKYQVGYGTFQSIGPLGPLVHGFIYQCTPTTKYFLQLDEETLR